ncbi:N-acetylglucosaminyl transferase [Campylobacter pinnipediorum subsp. caledonicus]|uniref:UDP-N-acetylglucosamine--N-acetylmuramyl-(pentapeptide) pyrophosphoryl-undecaprenol N-acetylglucosamine transferase n=1 Tax=Campylobacter pinnipediorum subsp. caledonicus TaxID=1874362 RepID=A0A1S6U732_9BACT|nr:undecaprenyldiphospho-muramoylpentapeptide beta-N-acetylglucosaminyltransferase [Campylobacter pinnipediorum]AQW87551.1 N-acetylglucosaminyl transferase [Campylobacter pinnipediorum subsp. caledonicus]
MIAITGGGTGGHLAIARSFCHQLKQHNKQTIFIGSTNGQDKMWFENDTNFNKKYFLQSSGVVNKKGLNKLKSFLNIIKLSFECKKIFKQNNIKAVISVGGYSAAPASLAAILSNIPIFIHEQNAIIGKLNYMLKPFAKQFYSSYEKHPFAYPVSDKFFQTQRVRSNLKTILFLGGSQGAKAINELAIKIAPILKEKNINIIHQCGKDSLQILNNQYKELGFTEQELELFDFCNNIEKKMQKADLAITRSGASSLWELIANALPCIFIPFPHAAKNHQYHNAKFLQDKNLAKISTQIKNSANDKEILKMIEEYDIKNTSELLSNLIHQDNTDEIIKDIISKLND